MKLSEAQKEVVATMSLYPNDSIILLPDYVTMTGGHGVRFERRIVGALMRKGVLKNGKLVKTL